MPAACVLLMLPVFSRKLMYGYLPHACAILLCGLIITVSRSLRDRGYTASQLGLTPMKNRDMRYDWLRLVSVLLVVLVHAIDGRMPFITEPGQTVVSGVEVHAGGTLVYIMSVLRMLGLSGNILFIMLSGALLLKYKENESIGKFYVKRFSRVVLPMMAAIAFYLWINREIPESVPDLLKLVLYKFWTGDYSETPFYWLLYVLLSLYTVFPFFRYMFRDMPYKALTALTAACIIFMYLQSPQRTYTFAVTTILTWWIAFAIMGLWMSRPETERYYKPLKFLGLTAFIYICYLIRRYGDYSSYISRIVYFTPHMSFLVMGEFALVFDIKALKEKQNIFLRFFSKYSFSIILMHWFCLFIIVRKFLLVFDPTRLAAGVLYDFVMTIICSMAAAFAFENFVNVIPLYVFDRLVQCLSGLYYRLVQKTLMKKQN